MNLTSPEKINSVIDNMKTPEVLRASQRALLNSFFNGEAPWTQKEADDNKILFNFNDKTGPSLLYKARGQYENAFLKSDRFFAVSVDAPPDTQAEWSATITKRINKTMKASRQYLHVQRGKFAGVVLHGVGGQIWWDDHKWVPSPAAIQDVLIPTDTEITMENLQYFSVRRKMRPGELFRKTIGAGKNARPGWNLKLARAILEQFKDLNQNPQNYDWANNPEQMAELYKQNLTYYDSDSAPVIWFQDFFFKESGENGGIPGWHRRILLDKDNTNVGMSVNDDFSKQFVYAPKSPYAPDLDQIIQFQFGDGNNVTPFLYHSIRSLAFLVYELMWTLNRLNCQFAQHVFEQLMTWIKVSDPTDRGRIEQISMAPPFAIMPDGMSIVSAQERYKVEPQLVNLIQSQLRQNISESSSTYTQALNDGTQKERTKFEVEAILSQISALMQTMLTLAYAQEFFAYREIARRFTIKNSTDFDVKKFRSGCIMDGVPEKYLDFERWDITVEQVLGGGNKMLALAQARELRGMRPDLPPTAQQEVDRIYITELTDNPKLASSLVPRVPQVTDSVHDAELAFGTLMQGVEVTPREGTNYTEQIATVLKLMGGVVARINATDKVGTPQDIIGLKTASVYVAKQIGLLGQNPNNKALVKSFGDALGKLMNEVKAMSQRQAEKSAASNGNGQQVDPETIAKVRGMVMLDNVKAQSKARKDRQSLVHKQQSFEADQARKNMQSVSDVYRETAKSVASQNGNEMSSAKE